MATHAGRQRHSSTGGQASRSARNRLWTIRAAVLLGSPTYLEISCLTKPFRDNLSCCQEDFIYHLKGCHMSVESAVAFREGMKTQSQTWVWCRRLMDPVCPPLSSTPSTKQREETGAGRGRWAVMKPDVLALPRENQQILVTYVILLRCKYHFAVYSFWQEGT